MESLGAGNVCGVSRTGPRCNGVADRPAGALRAAYHSARQAPDAATGPEALQGCIPSRTGAGGVPGPHSDRPDAQIGALGHW